MSAEHDRPGYEVYGPGQSDYNSRTRSFAPPENLRDLAVPSNEPLSDTPENERGQLLREMAREIERMVARHPKNEQFTESGQIALGELSFGRRANDPRDWRSQALTRDESHESWGLTLEPRESIQGTDGVLKYTIEIDRRRSNETIAAFDLRTDIPGEELAAMGFQAAADLTNRTYAWRESNTNLFTVKDERGQVVKLEFLPGTVQLSNIDSKISFTNPTKVPTADEATLLTMLRYHNGDR